MPRNSANDYINRRLNRLLENKQTRLKHLGEVEQEINKVNKSIGWAKEIDGWSEEKFEFMSRFFGDDYPS